MKYIRLFIVVIFFLLVCSVSGQEIRDTVTYKTYLDSVRLREITPSGLMNTNSENQSQSFTSPATNNGVLSEKSQSQLQMTYKPAQSSADLIGPQNIISWDSGALYGSNTQYFTNMWGYYATANILATQQIDDNWLLAGGAGLQKYGGMYNTFSLNGSATYLINKNISATAFGNYESPSFLTQGNLGASYEYGGYMSFETNNHKWGMDVGARHGFNPWNGQHYTIPIARPYYKIGKNKIGIDFGGLFSRQNNDGPPIFVPRPRK